MVKRTSSAAAVGQQTTMFAPSWTDQQEAIFAHRGALAVDAKAGTGKTTTAITAAAKQDRGSTMAMFAFNKTAAAELQKKASPGIYVKTLNGAGDAIVRANLKRSIFVKDGRARDIVERVCEQDKGRPGPFRSAAVDVVNKAREILAPETEAGMLDIVDRFSIDWTLGKLARATPEIRREARADMAQICLRTMEICRTDLSRFDFPDQSWLPHVLDLRRHMAWSHIYVDEAQDLNEGQIQLVRRLAEDDACVTVIGDPYQAIYQFRGADRHAFERLVATFSCTRRPLSVTFRCPQVVVRLARNIVPEYQAGPNNLEGQIIDLAPGEVLDHARPGDFIVSRKNAPLVGYCLGAIRRMLPAHILGRDVAKGLRDLMRGAGKQLGNPDKAAFLRWLAKWEHVEVDARIMEKRETDDIVDKAECVRAIWEYVDTLEGAIETLDRIYVEDETGLPRTRLTLGSTHKAKGLEADRVFVLEDTYSVGKKQEERNLYYVAITRAKSTVFFVNPDRAVPQWAAELHGRLP
jgi:superfamily I DNA/RNA helicase